MRTFYLLVFVVALVTIQIPALAIASAPACTTSTCIADITRSIITNDWGTTLVNDTIHVKAGSSVSSMTLGIPTSIAANLHQMTAKDGQGGIVQVNPLAVNQTGKYQPYEFAFPGPETGDYTFTVQSVFSDLVSFDTSASKYAFSFSAFPVADGSSGTVSANVTVLTRDWPTPVTIPGNATTSGGRLSMPTAGTIQIKPFNATVWKTTFSATGTSQNMFDVSAARTINISSAGTVRVSDTYNMTNKGRDAPNIVFSLPQGASSITCNDLIGQLDPSNCLTAVLGDGTVSVTFSPRFSTVKNGGAAVATLQYALSGGSYVSSTGLGEYSLSFNLLNDIKFVTSNLQTKIVLPTGGRVGKVSGQTPDVSGNQVFLEASKVTPYTSLGFTMTYSFDPFWSSLAPLSWTALIVGALIAGALVLSSGLQAGGIGFTPLQLITRFVELYDEKSSLRLEGEKLEEDVGRGAVAKYDYKRRRRVMDLRLIELDKLLNPLKEELASSQSRYDEMLKRVERAEAELQQVKTSLEDLRNQSRSGRISRQLYDQLSTDLQKRRNRAQQTIDNVVIGLREEAR
jgi:hypothetical protein